MDEKTRLCPSCRMEISVLATKCRYCGESVGRPKEEARNLSIDDLGGENVRHYAPSSSVLDALESFRAEEQARLAKQEQEIREGVFRRRKRRGRMKDGEANPNEFTGLPELDEQSRALASVTLPTYEPAPPRPFDVWSRKLGLLGAFIAAIIILYFGGVQVSALIRDWMQTTPVVESYDSRVPMLMEQGAPGVQILEAAMEAVRNEDSAEHREHLASAREIVRAEIGALLNADPWTMNHLSRASAIAHRAAQVDTSGQMNELKSVITRETWAYNMRVTAIDDTGPGAQATIRLLDPRATEREATVRVGGMVADRFRVAAISPNERFVRLEDTERDDRVLIINMDTGSAVIR